MILLRLKMRQQLNALSKNESNFLLCNWQQIHHSCSLFWPSLIYIDLKGMLWCRLHEIIWRLNESIVKIHKEEKQNLLIGFLRGVFGEPTINFLSGWRVCLHLCSCVVHYLLIIVRLSGFSTLYLPSCAFWIFQLSPSRNLIFVSPFINAMIVLHTAANYKLEMLRRSQQCWTGQSQ